MPPILKVARENKLLETVGFLVVAIILAVALQAFAIKPYKIPSGSMEPTLHVGDRILVNRFAMRVLGRDPKVGDIMVFFPPQSADAQPSTCGASDQGGGTDMPCSRPVPEKGKDTFVKRVVGVGGDTIAVRGGHVIRNGKLTREPFAARCLSDGCDFPDPITVPKGYVFMMGDNRGNSNDSRFWGPVPLGWVVGKAFATYWPPSRIGGAG